MDKKELLSIPKCVFNANVYDGNKIAPGRFELPSQAPEARMLSLP